MFCRMISIEFWISQYSVKESNVLEESLKQTHKTLTEYYLIRREHAYGFAVLRVCCWHGISLVCFVYVWASHYIIRIAQKRCFKSWIRTVHKFTEWKLIKWLIYETINASRWEKYLHSASMDSQISAEKH